MPPLNSTKKLTPRQIKVLQAWIAQGAKYDTHWSFKKPQRPLIPTAPASTTPDLARMWKTWPRNDVDRFLLTKMTEHGLRPSPEADRRTLIRRVSFDLTGLPPTPQEVNAFLYDQHPDAYERLVDRLLASPHYGERMTLAWLDLARYADTHGFHIDSQRDMWRWRDWVIDSFNRNQPYDQFTIEQIAGDLLPNATQAQKIATGFNRNHPINFEGGAIPEEYQTAYIVDRIDTTATTFLGLTMRCAQCHDHKYDPITQKDYYRFYGYFNSIKELGLDGQTGNAVPYMKAPTPDQAQKLDTLNAHLTALEGAQKARGAELAPALAEWKQKTLPTLATTPAVANGLAAHFGFDEGKGEAVTDALGKSSGTIKGKAAWGEGKLGGALTLDGKTIVDAGTSLRFDRQDKFSYGAWVFPTGDGAKTVISRMDESADFRGWDLYLDGGNAYVHLISKWDSNAIRVNTKGGVPQNEWHHVFVTYDGSSKAKGVHIYIDGKPAELEITHDALSGSIVTEKPVIIGRRSASAAFMGRLDELRVYNRELSAAEVAELTQSDTLRGWAQTPDAKRTPEQQSALADYFLTKNDSSYRKIVAEVGAARKERDDYDKTIPTSMVMEEMDKPRDTFMLARGQYDQHGAKVTPATPSFLPALATEAKGTRLELARWLASSDNPLTARVEVNRLWQMLFGTGLVKTAEDFGTQGERPSHPELLDWLATEFVRTGWDVKNMVRLFVTSAAYRQSSHVTKEGLSLDPENRLLARAPRIRLQAEFLRDQALAVSGLLSSKIGGPSVKPYQPAGLWEELSFSTLR